MGLVLGVGAEWLLAWSEDRERGGNRVHDPEQDWESLVEVVQRRLGLTGPGVNVAAACASANYALALGRRWVRRGWVDVCLAGGVYLLVKQPLYLSAASLVLHFDSQAVPDIDRTRTPTQLQGTNEHREILYSDSDILRSPALIRKTIAAIGLNVRIALFLN